MACWTGSLGFRGLQGENLAAVSARMRGNRSLRGGGRSGLSLQARAPGIRKSHPKEHQLQRPSAVNRRPFTSSAEDGDRGDDDETDGLAASPSKVPPDSLPKAWKRSLSPLERLSRMVPEEFLSGEVKALRSLEVKGNEAGAFPQPDFQPDPGSLPENTENAPSRNCPFRTGELVLIEARRKHGTELKNLYVLNSTGTYNSELGYLRFSEIIGKLSGQMLQTSQGHLLLIRRPALEEYALLMTRGPTIIYPKDANTILLLMDITQGDTVLEAGSGSGSMSLFLSRAVGSQGRVLSYEIRKDYHILAKRNYWKWRNTWKIGHSKEWPDNVDFINQDILTAIEDLKSVTLDAVVLDMLCPQNALPAVFPSLKQGGVCIVYLSNITQIIEVIEAIRISKLALFCEKIVDVTHKDWLIYPAKWKKTDFLKNIVSNLNMDGETTPHCEEMSAEERRNNAFVSTNSNPHYIARPFPYQVNHTAFLIKLRKFNFLCPNTASNGMCQFENQTSSAITH